MRPAKLVLMLPVYFIGLLMVMFIFTVLNKAFWDARVRYLCANEGGVTVFETVDMSASAYASVPRDVNGIPYLTTPGDASSSAPFFITLEIVEQGRFGGATTARIETVVKRWPDSLTLGTEINYLRQGGDFLDFGSPGTSFSCHTITARPLELPLRIFASLGER